MKTLITYSFITGNTARLAFAIFDEIRGDKSILKISDVKSLENYDLVFIGFPIYNFQPNPEAVMFMSGNLKGKNIALFTTMSLTAVPKDDQKLELYNTTIENCKKCCGDANLLGIFDCPGELNEETANALMMSDNQTLNAFGALRPLTIGFPNEKNIADARLFAKEICERKNYVFNHG